MAASELAFEPAEGRFHAVDVFAVCNSLQRLQGVCRIGRDTNRLCMPYQKRAMHGKLRRPTLAEHLGEELGSREVSTQTELAPGEATTPLHFRPQSTAQTPRQRAESVLQAQPKVCLANPSTPIHSWRPVLLNLAFLLQANACSDHTQQRTLRYIFIP